MGILSTLGDNILLCFNAVLTSFLFKQIDPYSHSRKMERKMIIPNIQNAQVPREWLLWKEKLAAQELETFHFFLFPSSVGRAFSQHLWVPPAVGFVIALQHPPAQWQFKLS